MILSNDSKKQLARRTADVVVFIVSTTIDEINKGPVKTIDELVKQRLDKGSKLC